MATIEGVTTNDIRSTLAPGQRVYGSDGQNVGWVDNVYHETDYLTVQARPSLEKRDNPLAVHRFYVPFRLITNIDPRELYLSVSRDELDRDYADPPARSTFVEHVDGQEIATTIEPSGYPGPPIVVDRVRIDQLKKYIAVGDRVFTSDVTDLGAVKKYDSLTGWMLVEHGAPWQERDLMIPITLVNDVYRETSEVYLVSSEADLRRMRHLEPADVVFVNATAHEDR